MNQFYENIKVLTRKRGATLEQLEAAIKIGKGSTKNWIQHSPSVITAKKAADFLGVTVDELLK